ncbi:Uncharacterized protein TCM_016370 [Theobroma cacao]|uniref:Uncharacterized protein n=1 Tax=Theobroma cacao TaxID=3641 RepID=A0A061GCV9_THECC|nr:Uncharacterized protein TCM_016370 [Theobroma cacao]
MQILIIFFKIKQTQKVFSFFKYHQFIIFNLDALMVRVVDKVGCIEGVVKIMCGKKTASRRGHKTEKRGGPRAVEGLSNKSVGPTRRGEEGGTWTMGAQRTVTSRCRLSIRKYGATLTCPRKFNF